MESGWAAQRWNRLLLEGGSLWSQEEFKHHLATPLAEMAPISISGSDGNSEPLWTSQDQGLMMIPEITGPGNRGSINITAISTGNDEKCLWLHQILSPFSNGPELTALCLPIHPYSQRAGVGAHSPPSLIFQENSKKCYSFEMRTWPLVLSCIFIHGFLAIAHLLLEIN